MLNVNAGSYLSGGISSYGASGSYNRNATSANIRSMSRDVQAGYSADIELIQKYLKQGKTDKAIDVYEDLMNEVEASSSNYRYQVNEAQIQSAIKTAFESTTGTSLVNTISDNTCGSFMTGLKQSIPIIGLFCNDTSEAEALAKLTGEEVSFKDKALEFAGLAVGTLAFWCLGGPVLGAVGTAIGKIPAGIKTALSSFKLAGKIGGFVANNATLIASAASIATTGINAVDEATDEFSQHLA